jgi:glycerophosphoryl diester phosphodiesterase
MTATDFMAIAHRGASSYAPENTIAAFDLALAMGVRHIELDVHATRDGEIVVIHDDTVDRTTDGTGPVAAHTRAALKALDAGAWFADRFSGERIPTFDEVLDRYKERAHIHVEIKGRSAGLTERTVDLVRRHGMADSITVTSFQRIRLEETRAYAPELPTGWLVAEVDDAVLAQARAIGITQICPRASTVTRELVRRAHADGFVVRAWGVSTEDLMRHVLECGADGMTVNFPDTLLAWRRRTT